MKFKTGALLAAVLTAACALLIFPAQAARGAANGVGYSLDILVPSLYPFMVLSVFVVRSGLAGRIGGALQKPTRALFRLPGGAAATLLMSVIGGYPAGARSVAALYAEGIVSRAQAQRMLCFCVSAGPPFVVTAVGIGFLKSAGAGALLLSSQVAAFLIMGVLCGIAAPRNGAGKSPVPKKKAGGTAQALIDSAADAAYSTLMMCCFVILFAVLMNLLRLFVTDPALSAALSSLLEITGGCADLARLGVPLWGIAFALGWGGVCVHFQVLACTAGVGVKKGRFLLCRLLQGALAAAVCRGLCALFPESAQVFQNIEGPVSGVLSNSAPAAAALALLCLALLLCVPRRVEIAGKPCYNGAEQSTGGDAMFGKKKKMFGGGIEPRCEYCVHFSESAPCRFGKSGTPCRRFRYDPLRRTPVSPPPLKKHDPGEFTL